MRGLDRWLGATPDDPSFPQFARDISDNEAGRRLLEAIFGNSPFLSQCLVSDPAFARVLIETGPDQALSQVIAGAASGASSSGELAGTLRRLKKRAALAIGIADICGAWELEQITDSLTLVAETALEAAVGHLLAKAAAEGELELPSPAVPTVNSGLIVLGMGKLGARELNYSSDIDLIVLYDRERIRYTGKHGPERCFTRLARDLVKLMGDRTRDGYVFRTDLRLRPDPGSTPPAISTLAAEVYYESAGQNWERAAMIKARPVAGDLDAGMEFLEILRPFIWRRSLDFAAIQDIHSIKRQINAHRGGAEISAAGHNIKLGRGGIREIEFFAQTQQLIWGGRDPTLRERGTLAALDALVAAGRVARQVADELHEAYKFLRRLEHRLQMVDDQQTHTIPEDAEGFAAIASFMGYPSDEDFRTDLISRLRTVEQHYAVLFEEGQDLSGPGNLVFTGSDDDPDTLISLQAMGYREPTVVSAAIRGWHHGRYRATRSARARELLTELVPAILQALAKTVNPDAALLRFNEFLAALPAGIQLFSLFHANPPLLDLVAEIMGSAPRLAERLSRHPVLLDGVLAQGFFDAPETPETMSADLDATLTQARDFQDVLDLVRRWTNDQIFRIGVHMLRHRTDPEQAGPHLSDVADTGLIALMPAVIDEFSHRHGTIRGAELAVVALGKLGGREMTVGSDLDLMLVYDAPDPGTTSDGERSLTPGHYFARLSQRYINAITAPTGEGKLYEVDMRLRPSGNSGPIATSLEAFVRYHAEDAWTWEHMALTRARIVLAGSEFAARLGSEIRAILTRRRDPEKLLKDVADMRERIERERPAAEPWQIKYYRGGLVDIEFLAQYLQLNHAHDHPEVLATNTTDALARLGKAGLIDIETADELIDAMHMWRNIQGIIRLSFGANFVEENAPEGLRHALARAAGAADFVALRSRVIEVAERSYAHFMRLVAEPAAAIAVAGSGRS